MSSLVAASAFALAAFVMASALALRAQRRQAVPVRVRAKRGQR
ncbi:hypothetical protein [Xanthobacter dioxanivorans]|nr:hypothetical protein [Xanthobacter dioxanivorans]